MGGIVGILNADARTVDRDHMQSAVSRLQHRGADGSEIWIEGAIGLGHLASNTTPEAGRKAQPLKSEDGSLILTAHARIDNRADLHRELGLKKPLGTLTDADLILAAYRQWGTECASHLIGAFAFALWDARAAHLFCARDHAGLRPFYYHHRPGERFVFGSEIKALFAFPGIPDDINEACVADYLVGLVSDHEYTFYQHVLRLPPAHTLTVTRDAVRLARYWSLDPEREIRFDRDEDYADAFRETFEEAVRCRLRAPDPIGLTLSGGMDSSAVAVVGQAILRAEGREPLHTFSNVFDLLPECDERTYIESTLRRGTYHAHYIDGETTHFPLTPLGGFVRALDQPFFAPGMGASIEIRRRLREENVRVVLNGHGGDEVVSRGIVALKELALQGRWLRLGREVYGLTERDSGGSPTRLLLQYLIYGAEGRLRGRRFARLPARMLGRARRALRDDPPSGNEGARGALRYVNPTLAVKIDLEARYRVASPEASASARSLREAQYATLVHPMQALALEVLEGIHAAEGIEERVPFWDRRLVEFCLALPADQKRRNGYGRYVLRQALHDKLSREVRTRRNKTGFNANLLNGLLKNDPEALAAHLQALDELSDFANVDALREDLVPDEFEERPTSAFTLIKVAALREWLNARDRAAG